MQIDIIFKITALGILVWVLNQILTKADKSEIATIVTITGLVIALLSVVNIISELFSAVRTLFGL